MSSNIAPFDGMLRISNTESEDIPAHSIAQVINVEQYNQNSSAKKRSQIRVKKPDGTGSIFVCVPRKVKASSNGWAYSLERPRWIAYDPDGGDDPTSGSEWGPVSGSWKIERTGSGILVWGIDGSRPAGKELAQCTLKVASSSPTPTPTTGESECTCGTCIDAGSVTDCASLADDAPLNYRITMPTAALIAAFGTYVVLTYTGSASCTWESDTFNSIDLGDGAHNYTWKLVFAGEGIEEATLTLEDEL